MSEIEQIVASVQASRKYRSVCVDTIRRVAADEWKKRGALRSAIKATKSRLHQVYGAYEVGIDYDRAYDALRAAYAEGDRASIQMVCRRLLSLHASTRERLSVQEQFYGEIWGCTGVPRSILDLACGLNPLAVPWMGLEAGTAYHAYDIDGERVAFLERYLLLAGCEAHAHLQDVICDPPDEPADVALLLKSATCLERQREGSTTVLLDAIQVGQVVVSFPLQSLGRRKKGMPEHYARTFAGLLSGRPWTVTRLDMRTELVFIVDKR